ncbi:MAG: methylmalonyl Co-A mutase-associated GTPase MeaB [Anaerolineae bacterium]|nr:methylmalonyl Co-A mutase-associated GTPase MeaB [Thermoflexales bacterium]MDW8407166.1 methylmalonyl Co-A mutase-associated GTPase MeaB [Anaerolineae bacterium]
MAQSSTAGLDMVADLMSDRRALARLITQIENGAPEARQLVTRLYRRGGRAHIVGVTGAPGCGKSTLVAALARQLRVHAPDAHVAIIAVDPSSAFSGGAILGDRLRMRSLAGDAGVFIRSMASRGALGGVAAATADVVEVLDAVGFGTIFIETVGAGQLEVDVARIAQTVVVVEAPGAGDEVQAIKAGILEIADVVVVNKADREGATQTVAALQSALDIGRPMPAAGLHAIDPSHHLQAPEQPGPSAEWRPPILKTVASHEEGIAAVIAALEEHRQHLQLSGAGARRRARAVEQDVRARLGDLLLRRALRAVPQTHYNALIAGVIERTLHPLEAAEQLFIASWGQ